MGLVLKAPKRRSLSITGGKTSNIHFTLNNSGSEVKRISVLEKNMKFLESEVTGDSSKSAMFASIKLKLESKLENIHKSTLLGEYKLKIYS